MDRQEALQFIRDNSRCIHEESFEVHKGKVYWQLRARHRDGQTFFLVEHADNNGFNIYWASEDHLIDTIIQQFEP